MSYDEVRIAGTLQRHRPLFAESTLQQLILQSILSIPSTNTSETTKLQNGIKFITSSSTNDDKTFAFHSYSTLLASSLLFAKSPLLRNGPSRRAIVVRTTSNSTISFITLLSLTLLEDVILIPIPSNVGMNEFQEVLELWRPHLVVMDEPDEAWSLDYVCARFNTKGVCVQDSSSVVSKSDLPEWCELEKIRVCQEEEVDVHTKEVALPSMGSFSSETPRFVAVDLTSTTTTKVLSPGWVFTNRGLICLTKAFIEANRAPMWEADMGHTLDALTWLSYVLPNLLVGRTIELRASEQQQPIALSVPEKEPSFAVNESVDPKKSLYKRMSDPKLPLPSKSTATMDSSSYSPSSIKPRAPKRPPTPPAAVLEPNQVNSSSSKPMDTFLKAKTLERPSMPALLEPNRVNASSSNLSVPVGPRRRPVGPARALQGPSSTHSSTDSIIRGDPAKLCTMLALRATDSKLVSMNEEILNSWVSIGVLDEISGTVITSKNEAKKGLRGALLITGPGAPIGCFHQPSLSADFMKIDSDGRLWFKTGDVVEIEEDESTVVLAPEIVGGVAPRGDMVFLGTSGGMKRVVRRPRMNTNSKL